VAAGKVFSTGNVMAGRRGETTDVEKGQSFTAGPVLQRTRFAASLKESSSPYYAFALPTDSDLSQPQIFLRNHLQSIFIRDESQFDTRSIYGIIWSCLSTIFMCTWIAVHPNIPAPGDSQWAVLRRRVAIMGHALIAPEMVIMWAGRQHYAARTLAKKPEKNHPGWTRAHAFF